MNQLRALLLLILLLFAAPAVASEPAQPAPEREILVMVKHPADHFRPGGSYSDGYGDSLAQSQRERLARRIARSYKLKLVDAWPMSMIGYDCFVMLVPDDRTTSAAAEQVSHDGDVAWAQPVDLYTTQGGQPSHNDPLFAAEPAAHQWRLAELHRIATGRGVRVAVIDSGIDAHHPDLAGQVVVNHNFVAGRPGAIEEHGTGVAGIIAAKADNGLGIAGVAPGSRLLGLRACWQVGPSANRTVCDSFSLAKALYFAIENRADVINLSLTGPDNRLLRELVQAAMAKGLTVVAAFDQNRADGGFPASVPGVFAVSDDRLARSRGGVYTAPGHDIPTTEPGGRWFLVTGSSYAAAHVSGLAALMRQRQHKAALNFISEGGAIDACATLVHVAGRCDCSCGSAAAARSSAR